MNIEDKVRDALHARANAVELPEAAWNEVASRFEAPRPRPSTRIAAALVAATVAVAGLGFAFVALRPAAVDVGARPEGWTSYGSGWTRLPATTDLPGSAWVWTGSEIIAWGGQEEDDPWIPSAAGSRFAPTIGAWRPIPDAPEARTDVQAVWTGREVIFWGGWDREETERRDGLRFDPATDEWSMIPPAPLGTGEAAVSVWTGTEMIVWGGGEPGSIRNRQGAAYDPAANTWRELPLAPIGLNLADGVWTGDEMIVFGSLLDGRNIASTQTAVGARYNPKLDRWSELEPSDLSPQATALGFVDGGLLAYDYAVRSQTYDVERGAWSAPSKMPLRASECYPDLAVVQDVAFAFYCGEAAVYRPGGDWRRLAGGMLDETYQVGGDSYQLYRFATIVPVDDGIVFAVEGITTSDTGEVCYGCPGAPRAVWLWRP